MKVFPIKLEEITINRERFRGATGDMEGLATSLVRFGQLQPIIVEENGELVDGFRRYNAALMNGWTELFAVKRGDIDEVLARELELETNIQRQDMSWLEKANAVKEIDRLKRLRDPSWNQTKTAIVAGLGPNNNRVSEAIKIANMAELFPELKKAKSFRQAKNMAEAKAALIERKVEIKAAPEDYKEIEERLVHGDSREVIKTIESNRFRAIITDPPFGINYDERIAGTVGEATAYEDSEEYYRTLLGMAPELYRVLKEDGFLIWFLGISWYEEAKQTFRKAGFIVDECPIIWNRSEGRCFTNRPDRYFARGYDIALHCIKGDPKLVQKGKPNVLTIKPVDSDDREALVERPVELYEELIRRTTFEGEEIADFFAGSGSCPAAAEKSRRKWFACELSSDRRAIALNKIRSYKQSK